VSGTRPVQRVAERLISAACRRLPADVRAERFREWTAELPAILDDESIGPSWLRGLRALAFCVGISRATRQLSRSALAGSRRIRNSQWRSGAPRTRPNDMAVRLAVGLVVFVVVVAGIITVLTTYPDPRGWPFLLLVALGIGFDVFCLADIARASEVRYLSKWAWALICLAQTPGGGIVYLCVGRADRARSAPPGPAQRP
jgi:Phospholipase_D-nuclease N-terminal